MERKFEEEIEENIKCVCGRKLTVDVYEYDAETGAPTEAGFHFWCGDEPYDNCGLSYQEAIQVEININCLINEILEKENSSPSDYPGTDYFGLPAQQ